MVELYGKCRELGYCDCRGFFGCVDTDGVKPKPDSATLKAAARQHDTVVNEKDVSRYAEAMPELTGSMDHRLVDCEVCDKSHQRSHPHIANIDGDVPIDDAPLFDPIKVSQAIVVPAELPAWLQDKPKDRRSYATKRNAPKCEVCGVIKRSNHNCKGAVHPQTKPQIDERVATELPKPVRIVQSAAPELPQPTEPLDPELAAIGAILTALEGFDVTTGQRVLWYVADRLGIEQK